MKRAQREAKRQNTEILNNTLDGNYEQEITVLSLTMVQRRGMSLLKHVI